MHKWKIQRTAKKGAKQSAICTWQTPVTIKVFERSWSVNNLILVRTLSLFNYKIKTDKLLFWAFLGQFSAFLIFNTEKLPTKCEHWQIPLFMVSIADTVAHKLSTQKEPLKWPKYLYRWFGLVSILAFNRRQDNEIGLRNQFISINSTIVTVFQ